MDNPKPAEPDPSPDPQNPAPEPTEPAVIDRSDWRDVQDDPWQPDEEAPPPVIGQ